ncbi:SRPBCC family protein [soil metagenome]
MPDDVVRETHLAAPPEEVWRSLTEPGELSRWLAEDAHFDLRPGGDLRMRTEDGEERTGWVEEANPSRRLAFWWRAGEDAEPTRVEIELEEDADGTRLVLTESRPMALLDARAHALSSGSRDEPRRGPQMLALR